MQTSNYITTAGLKRKCKQYLLDINQPLKTSIYPKLLVTSLINMIDDLIGDSITLISKNDNTGIYTITEQHIKSVVFDIETDHYQFLRSYVYKYNKQIKYADLLFFNVKKLITTLEEKYGKKMMLDYSGYNLLCYLFSSFQYNMIDLSIQFVKYSKKSTLTKQSFLLALEYLVHKDIVNKLKLKLDSLDILNKEDDIEEDDIEDVDKELNKDGDMEEFGNDDE